MKAHHFLALALILFAIVGCQNNTAQQQETQLPAQLQVLSALDNALIEDLARQFVQAASQGDTQAIQRLFITKEEYKTIFSANDIDSVYTALENDFQKALAELLPMIPNAEFVRMNTYGQTFLPIEPGFVTDSCGSRPGQPDNQLEIISPLILTGNDVGVIVSVFGQELQIKLDSLIKVGDNWRLANPISLID